MQRRNVISPAVLLLTASLTACGGGGSAPAVTQTLAPAPMQTAPAGPVQDEWSTFGRDFTHSSTAIHAAATITTQSVNQLQLRWSVPLGEAVYSTPIAYHGMLIVVTHNTGTVYALDSSSGKVIWKTILGGQVRMTPTVSDGMLFVGTHLFASPSAGVYDPAPSDLYALNLNTGAQVWRTHLQGTVRASVVVANGTVYAGVAGGDPPTCLQGGIDAIDETTGALRWEWHVNPSGNEGGSVWSPLAFDGSHLIFGTGNTCNGPVSTANGVVALNLDGTLAWNLVSANSTTDDDTGGGAALNNGTAYILNKNGILYAINQYTGALKWTRHVGAVDGRGGIATPSTDGTTLFIATDAAASATQGAVTQEDRFFRRPLSTVPTGAPQGTLYALDMMGSVKWSLQTQAQMSSYVAIVGSIGFADLDNRIEAFDIATGHQLWSYTAGALINAGPVVVPSGVYTADSDGTVYAFGLPASAAPAP